MYSMNWSSFNDRKRFHSMTQLFRGNLYHDIQVFNDRHIHTCMETIRRKRISKYRGRFFPRNKESQYQHSKSRLPIVSQDVPVENCFATMQCV